MFAKYEDNQDTDKKVIWDKKHLELTPPLYVSALILNFPENGI